ncbi:MAG: DNA replication complex GINS family protein [Crenarchaeota archaeon]|nr:DNA replication complex GINS family protein [Thermoproteota archaeon]
MPAELKDLDFIFENTPVKIIANRNQPEIKLAGLSVGPMEEGGEYEVYYWIGFVLVHAGIAHFREDDELDATKLYKVQWKERVQAAGQISELTEDFYPKLRRYLSEIKKESTTTRQPERVQEYEKAKQLAWDIVNSRLKKIVSIASGPTHIEQIVKKFSTEEKIIYEQLHKAISEWRNCILKEEKED